MQNPSSLEAVLVTVLYNSDDVLPGMFASLAIQKDVRFKLVVVDNSASDSGCQLSLELGRRYGVNVEVIFNNANVGVAKGNNQGIQRALELGCPYIILANNDVEFSDPQFLVKLIEPLKLSEADMSVPKITYFGTNRLWYAGGYISRWRGIAPHLGYEVEDQQQFDTKKMTGYAPTCFMAIKAEVFKKVGLMDERYFVYFDDTDFVYRCLHAGNRLLYLPHILLEHKVSFSTGGGESKFSVYYLTRNRIYFVLKNFTGIQKYFAVMFTVLSRLVKFRKDLPHVCGAIKAGFVLARTSKH